MNVYFVVCLWMLKHFRHQVQTFAHFCKTGTNYCSLQNCIAANYQGQTSWTFSGQGIDMEGTATKCDK
jgi:hypothetical protein